MATVVFNHKVRDFNTFKSVYDADKARRDNEGMKELALGRRADDPETVYIIWEMADPSRIEAMVNSPELRQKMQEATVISEPEYFILK